jgi:hypothetical protein
MERICIRTFLILEQPPVIGWAGFAMCLLNINLGDADIVPHHLQAAAPQQ